MFPVLSTYLLDQGEDRWLILVASAAIAADCAIRGQYGTKAPSAAGLAHF